LVGTVLRYENKQMISKTFPLMSVIDNWVYIFIFSITDPFGINLIDIPEFIFQNIWGGGGRSNGKRRRLPPWTPNTHMNNYVYIAIYYKHNTYIIILLFIIRSRVHSCLQRAVTARRSSINIVFWTRSSAAAIIIRYHCIWYARPST